ncbi:aldehyde dehydrogenase family protein [Alkalihalobacillus deserti]|uniref:aldehyde dehydrogenase family protein n=1 Tax=Alkalihalobacillus deserti TaxID=2879466 RepID=UPI001D13E152|nr:aldehyde dehydrogenase family protein [Alkalihalobacillus deserti]
METNLLIGGKEIKTDQYLEVSDPGRLDDVIGYVAQGNPQHVDDAVGAAHKAYQSWRKVPLEDRIALVLKAADLLEKESALIAEVISKQNGILLNTTRAEVNMAVSVMRNSMQFAENFFKPVELEDETGWVSIEKKPMGVIAGIVPWNAPIVLTMQKLAPILIAGNTIVFKPSPFASIGITLILQKIGEIFPPGVINVVNGDGDVGEALTTHPLVRKISFTGGGPTAKSIMKSAANTLKGVHFELGGNDPAIVLEDANLETVVPNIVNGVFRRSGQFCYAIKRIYIPSSMYNHFYDLLCEHVDQYKIGHQMNPQATFGPVNNKNQYNNVKRLIENLRNSKAEMVELGEKLEPGNWDNGYYLNPIVVRNMKSDQELVTGEQFGPIIPLVSYQSEEEVIEMANATEYGLGSSIWATDTDRALRIAKEIESGMTLINTAFQTQLGFKHMPFGGVKESGIGRENSQMVFDEYVETHAININKGMNWK